jgi:hypothetical protein
MGYNEGFKGKGFGSWSWGLALGVESFGFFW